MNFASTDRRRLRELAELYNRDDISDDEFRTLYQELIADGTSESLIQEVLRDVQIQEALGVTNFRPRDETLEVEEEKSYWSSPYDDIELSDSPEQAEALADYFAGLNRDGDEAADAKEDPNAVTAAKLSETEQEYAREQIVRPPSSTNLPRIDPPQVDPGKGFSRIRTSKNSADTFNNSRRIVSQTSTLIGFVILGLMTALAFGVLQYSSTLPDPAVNYSSASNVKIDLGNSHYFEMQFGPEAFARCERRCGSFEEEERLLCEKGCARLSTENFAGGITPYDLSAKRTAMRVYLACTIAFPGPGAVVSPDASAPVDAARKKLLDLQVSMAELKQTSIISARQASTEGIEGVLLQANELRELLEVHGAIPEVYREEMARACKLAHLMEAQAGIISAEDSQSSSFYEKLSRILVADFPASWSELSARKAGEYEMVLDDYFESDEGDSAAGIAERTVQQIDFTDGSWRIASARNNRSESCEVFGKEFLCSEDDKRQYGYLLEELEEAYYLSQY